MFFFFGNHLRNGAELRFVRVHRSKFCVMKNRKLLVTWILGLRVYQMNGSKFVVECLIFVMCRGSLGGKYYWKDWSRTMHVFLGEILCPKLDRVLCSGCFDPWHVGFWCNPIDPPDSRHPCCNVAVTWLVLTCLNYFYLFLCLAGPCLGWLIDCSHILRGSNHQKLWRRGQVYASFRS